MNELCSRAHEANKANYRPNPFQVNEQGLLICENANESNITATRINHNGKDSRCTEI